ncbi:hypothetical protein AAC03nite_26490 [Alicyclobacillus acidoterrestris]|nr:hypothetical protein AAC03nite_26490 [Alicyclobacillus acidoterrestris]
MSTTVPADTVFSGNTSSFPSGPPGWNSPDPSAYAWTLPNTSHWYNVAQNISQGVFSFVANTLLELIAWVLHIAIYVCSYFSDPSNITNPVVHAASGVFKSAYQNVFVKFLPVLIMFFVAYLAWKYVVAHHAKMLRGIASVLLATGLVTFFFFDFGQVFGTIDSFGQLVTNTAASAVASTAGTNVGSEYDTLWQNYVLFPWEYGQFGGFSGTYSDFNVSSAVCSDPQVDCSFTNDAGQKATISGNWVTLFLSNTSSGARTSLENALTQAAQDGHNPFTGSSLSAQDVTNANPYAMIPFLVIEMLLILVPVIFLIYVGFQLFVRELLFIVTIMMGIVTIPMAFIPEIGWRITFNWLREAVGHQVERLGNAIYAALLFLVASLVTQSVTHSEFGMMAAFLVDAILFAAALIYRQKVFSIAVNPLSDSVRGVDQHQRMTMDEYIAQRAEGEEHVERRTLRGATIGKTGKLSEHFEHMEQHEEHHLNLPASHRSADTHHVLGSDEQPQFTFTHHEQKPMGHLADSFKDNANSTKRQKFARNVAEFRKGLGRAIQQHIEDVSNPGPPLSHEERIRRREQLARGLEGKIHRHAVKTLRRTISPPKLASGFSSATNDDKPDNPPAPAAPPADAGADNDKQRKVMVSADGNMTQTVVTDANGKEIAVEPPSVARPRRDEAEVSQPKMADTFNVPQPQVQGVDSSTIPAKDTTVRNEALSQEQQTVNVTPPAQVREPEQPAQSTLATGFSSEPEQETVSPSESGRLSSEKTVSDKRESSAAFKVSTSPPEAPTTQNGTDGQPTPEPVSEPKTEAVAPVSARSSQPAQPRPLPPNVTRIETEREHRAEVEGRQREQRAQRPRQQQQGRRRVARVNDRSPRPPRP